MFSLEALRMFVHAAESATFTEAAAKLRVSTPTISRTVAKLEQDLSVRLFSRNTRHLVLTDAGRTFLGDARDCLERLEAATDRLTSSHVTAAGRVKALIVNSFCKNYMMRDLGPLLERNPGLSIDMHVDDYSRDLLSEGFDLAVQYERPADGNYICRALGRMRIFLAASPAYLERHGSPGTIADLDRHQCIPMRATGAGAPFLWRLAPVGGHGSAHKFVVYKPAGRLFIGSQLDASVSAAIQGLGIVPIDLGAARKHLDSGVLKVVLPDYEVEGTELLLLYPHRDYLPGRTRVFIDFLTDVARRNLDEPFEARRYAA